MVTLKKLKKVSIPEKEKIQTGALHTFRYLHSQMRSSITKHNRWLSI